MYILYEISLALRFRRLRGPFSSFIVNLAVADLCTSLLHGMAVVSSFRRRWAFGHLGESSTFTHPGQRELQTEMKCDPQLHIREWETREIYETRSYTQRLDVS